MNGKLFKFLVFVTITSFSFVSCLKDDGYVEKPMAYGVVEGVQSQGNFSIVTDLGNVLNVKENADPSVSVEDGMRVVVKFSILSQKDAAHYDVKVYAMGKLLTKEPVRLSELTEEEQKEIGDDPIEVWDAWFGGKYLNINFMIYRSDPELAHFINLVVDERHSSEDEVIVTLRHNAFGDQPMARVVSPVSFDLSELVPEGKEEIKVTLKWTDYNGLGQSSSGVFKPGDRQQPAIVGKKENKPAAVPVKVK